MIIGVPKESNPTDRRVPLIPDSVNKLVKQGAEIHIETGMGEACGFTDQDYEKVGASIQRSGHNLLKQSDIILRLHKPSLKEIKSLKTGSIHVSYLDPFNEHELVDAFAAANVTAISMEMIPRITRAQKMDALSSQANLGGYAAVILAADRLDLSLPMMMTAAGTISPARVFIIGVGVAGLQAIATAKRLGARVEAFDTRPVVAEQVESLGAKFVQIDLGDTGETEGGYAKQLTEEQLELQRLGMKKVMAQSDIVITTAQVFGRAAPRIVTADMVEAMKTGSVIIDMAVETGGNVEGSKLDEEIEVNGVRLVGLGALPGRVCKHASQMYSANLLNLVLDFWSAENKSFEFDLADEILKGCVITHAGELVNDMILNARKNA
ncbi:MAG: Re/Si-specific NAD(P)(+) transhydrogenase subunit alpha [Gammaproteobacteria bacterium]|jgi:NAD(P) transhydrogenase subunit alpha|nr:NAD(P)(+) transhydrogenase (Re/Si-specific) subunit alpha [Gammaproteobacteria bacterium]MDP6096614.1 Re/Si-specific NAD(P)(+) transhydrogenase subunit alpha [Gammaproteobacteria bacterium]HJO12656.1 Re/Si-specific NAD(P)(+) transhydrogenase subunit alpha [Gammaproteobacteria bacterium]